MYRMTYKKHTCSRAATMYIYFTLNTTISIAKRDDDDDDSI